MCLVAVWLFQYILPWVANSCAIYPLAQSLVPETVYVVSGCFSKAIIGKGALFLSSDVPIFTAKLSELVLRSHTFLT